MNSSSLSVASMALHMGQSLAGACTPGPFFFKKHTETAIL